MFESNFSLIDVSLIRHVWLIGCSFLVRLSLIKIVVAKTLALTLSGANFFVTKMTLILIEAVFFALLFSDLSLN